MCVYVASDDTNNQPKPGREGRLSPPPSNTVTTERAKQNLDKNLLRDHDTSNLKKDPWRKPAMTRAVTGLARLLHTQNT